MFRVFLAFVIFAKFPLSALTADHVLCFLEFLASNNVSHSAIVNYLSAIKTKVTMFGLSSASFTDPRLRYFSRSLARNAALKVTLKSIIDIPILSQISQMCDSMYMGFVCKAAILLSFFSFLRISNLVPHSIAKFDPLKQLARGDIFFAPPGAHILLKWSKTLQMNNSVRLLKIPHLGSSPICPVTALRTLLSLTPSGPNKPLFQVKLRQQWVPLSDTRLRKHFSTILARLQLSVKHHFSLTSTFRCHLGFQCQGASTEYPESWHLDVGVCVVLHYSGPSGVRCCCPHIPTFPTSMILILGFGVHTSSPMTKTAK